MIVALFCILFIIGLLSVESILTDDLYNTEVVCWNWRAIPRMILIFAGQSSINFGAQQARLASWLEELNHSAPVEFLDLSYAGVRLIELSAQPAAPYFTLEDDDGKLHSSRSCFQGWQTAAAGLFLLSLLLVFPRTVASLLCTALVLLTLVSAIAPPTANSFGPESLLNYFVHENQHPQLWSQENEAKLVAEGTRTREHLWELCRVLGYLSMNQTLLEDSVDFLVRTLQNSSSDVQVAESVVRAFSFITRSNVSTGALVSRLNTAAGSFAESLFQESSFLVLRLCSSGWEAQVCKQDLNNHLLELNSPSVLLGLMQKKCNVSFSSVLDLLGSKPWLLTPSTLGAFSALPEFKYGVNVEWLIDQAASDTRRLDGYLLLALENFEDDFFLHLLRRAAGSCHRPDHFEGNLANLLSSSSISSFQLSVILAVFSAPCSEIRLPINILGSLQLCHEDALHCRSILDSFGLLVAERETEFSADLVWILTEKLVACEQLHANEIETLVKFWNLLSRFANNTFGQQQVQASWPKFKSLLQELHQQTAMDKKLTQDLQQLLQLCLKQLHISRETSIQLLTLELIGELVPLVQTTTDLIQGIAANPEVVDEKVSFAKLDILTRLQTNVKHQDEIAPAIALVLSNASRSAFQKGFSLLAENPSFHLDQEDSMPLLHRAIMEEVFTVECREFIVSSLSKVPLSLLKRFETFDFLIERVHDSSQHPHLRHLLLALLTNLALQPCPPVPEIFMLLSKINSHLRHDSTESHYILSNLLRANCSLSAQSMDILFQLTTNAGNESLSELLDAYVEGHPSVLPTLPVQRRLDWCRKMLRPSRSRDFSILRGCSVALDPPDFFSSLGSLSTANRQGKLTTLQFLCESSFGARFPMAMFSQVMQAQAEFPNDLELQEVSLIVLKTTCTAFPCALHSGAILDQAANESSILWSPSNVMNMLGILECLTFCSSCPLSEGLFTHLLTAVAPLLLNDRTSLRVDLLRFALRLSDTPAFMQLFFSENFFPHLDRSFDYVPWNDSEIRMLGYLYLKVSSKSMLSTTSISRAPLVFLLLAEREFESSDRIKRHLNKIIN